MRKVYVFIGPMGSGKSYNADLVAKKTGAVRIDFKDSLVDMAYMALGLSKNTDYSDFKSFEYQVPGTNQKFTGRQFMQRLGTDVMRNMVDKDIWCKLLIKKINSLPENIPVAIGDCRFVNEVRCLLNAGYDVEFYYTNFCSERFDDKNNHESELLARKIGKNIDLLADVGTIGYAGTMGAKLLKLNFLDILGKK